jgi:hypothetical protein
MCIEQVFEDSGTGEDPNVLPPEVAEGGEEFLEALAIRLSEIFRKPSGRFVISYVAGQPGARRPPKVQ